MYLLSWLPETPVFIPTILSTIHNILTVTNSSQKENIKTEISGQEVIKYFDLSPFVDVFKDRILQSLRWSQTPDPPSSFHLLSARIPSLQHRHAQPEPICIS